MSAENLKNRTFDFSFRVVHLVQSLPRNAVTDVLGKQLLRSGTSVGANYRSACRSRSHGDFISRMTIAEEEADEALFWMELIVKSKIVKESRLASLMQEARELTAIFSSSAKTAKQSKKQ